MAGNPFRRTSSSRLEDEGQAAEPAPATSKRPKKKKRVKIVSPPLSPQPTRRLSEARLSPPPPPQTTDSSEDTDSTATADSDLEEAVRNTRRNSGPLPPPPSVTETSSTKAPSNPFARTLATSEAAYGLPQTSGEIEKPRAQDNEAQRRASASRPALHVDEFKNILLTGSATPSPPMSTASQGNVSGTDVSTSGQSFFDSSYDLHTPRSSDDRMDSLESASSDDDDDDEHSSPADDMPSAGHAPLAAGVRSATKGPQTVSFADFDESLPHPITTPPASRNVADTMTPAALVRSSSDLNKPLPEPPRKALEEALAQSKKAPPPPPTSRRAGVNRSSTYSEDIPTPPKPSPSAEKAVISPPPPPPPSRRPRSIDPSDPPSVEIPPKDELPPLSPTTTKSMPPPPPPSRKDTKRPITPGRSVSSITPTNLPRPENTPAPPAPPPRRGTANRNSNDAGQPSPSSRPSSLIEPGRRRSSVPSVEAHRPVSVSSLTQTVEADEGEGSAPVQEQPSRDILADMSAFQAEIDALMARAGTG